MSTDLMFSCEFIRNHPLDAAQVLERLQAEEVASLIREISPPLAAPVVNMMNLDTAASFLEHLDVKTASALLTEIPLEIAAVLLRRLEGSRRNAVCEAIPHDQSVPLRLLLRYAEGTAGSLMDPKVFILLEDETVREALKRVRKRPEHIIYYLYAVNRQQAFAGYLSIRELMLAAPNARISDMMHTHIGRLSPGMSHQAILSHPGWREHHALPVVDEKGIFLGAIGYRTIRRLEQETSLDNPAGASDRTDSALGELYWIGLSGMVKWVLSSMRERKE